MPNNSYRENKILRKQKVYQYDIREFQLRSVCLLEAIDKVCKKYGIQYYIIAGTLLGAVRHKGFIPWDDDQDIALLRKDYDLLMQHLHQNMYNYVYVLLMQLQHLHNLLVQKYLLLMLLIGLF